MPAASRSATSPRSPLADEAQSYIARGYKALKLRLGDSAQVDAERALHVRKVLGDGVDILSDANTAYTIADARRVLPVLAEIRAGWLEEPFACNDFASYREAAKITPLVPLAAGENHYTRFEFAQLLEAGAVQVWQPDLSKCGGITEGVRIAAIASAWRIPINPHSSATGINHAATLHFMAATENSGYFEACVSKFNPFPRHVRQHLQPSARTAASSRRRARPGRRGGRVAVREVPLDRRPRLRREVLNSNKHRRHHAQPLSPPARGPGLRPRGAGRVGPDFPGPHRPLRRAVSARGLQRHAGARVGRQAGQDVEPERGGGEQARRQHHVGNVSVAKGPADGYSILITPLPFSALPGLYAATCRTTR
jgi:hypothetical protein